MTVVRVTRNRGPTAAAPSGLLESDWQARISGPGVVWYHDFRSDNEVNAFRWTQNFGSGNDPSAAGGTAATNVRRITTDGITGACMELLRTGAQGDTDFSVWWRPFSPIVGGTSSGNGRGAGLDDPGANGALTAQSYAATSGGNQVSTWGSKGAYGQQGATTFDGSEYYIQARVKIDPRRMQGGNASEDVGKLFYFTRTSNSATDQEIVVYSGSTANPPTNYLRMYRSVSPALDTDSPGVSVHGNQPGTQWGTVGDGVCRLDNNGGRRANCWFWPADGTWATVLFHIRPGTGGSLGSGVGNGDTLVEVFAALDGETEYTCIWSQAGVDLPFDEFYGHNALICSTYHNGDTMTDFWHRYCQLVFSKEFIPCPRVYGSTAPALVTAALNLASGASVSFPSGNQIFTDQPDGRLAWQAAFYYDERHGLVHLMGKTANADSDWSHEYYRISTGQWTIVSNGMWNVTGHIYGNMTIDPETGDVFCWRGQMDGNGGDQVTYKRAGWWKYSTGAWTVTPVDIYSGALVSHANGTAYHPHLFGRNSGGLVVDTEFRSMVWRKSNDAVYDFSHNDDAYGNKEGCGVYWPAKNAVYVGGADAGKPLRRFTPNSTTGGTPVATDMGVPPISTAAHSHLDGGGFGSLHVHPGNPNKLLLLETAGPRAWTSTDATNWTQIANHPFTQVPRVVCALHKYGVMWAVGHTGAANFSTLWKPAP